MKFPPQRIDSIGEGDEKPPTPGSTLKHPGRRFEKVSLTKKSNKRSGKSYG
jgi:hypothetical protein